MAQRSFAAGEVSPAVQARPDLVKHATGCRTLRNFVVLPTGGAAMRPGTVHVGTVKDASDGRVKTAAFVLDGQDIADTYLLEFGDFYVRFYQDGARIVVPVADVSAWADATAYETADLVSRSSVVYYCLADHTSATATDAPGTGSAWQATWYALEMDGTDGIYEIPTPWAVADARTLNLVQSGDVLTIAHPSYAPRDLSRRGHTEWLLTETALGPTLDGPANLAASGGVAGADTYYAVTAVQEGSLEESLASLVTRTGNVPDAATPIALEWDPVTGAIEYNIYRSANGSTYGYLETVGGTPLEVTDTAWGTASNRVSTTTADAWVASAGQARNALAAIASAADKAYDGNYRIAGTVLVDVLPGTGTAIETSGRVRAYYRRGAETRKDAGVVKLSPIVSGEGSSGIVSFEATINVPDNGYTSLTIDLVPEVFGTSSGGTSTYECTVEGTSVTWSTASVGYSDDDDLEPDTSIAPPQQATLFQAADTYPATVGYYQQRRLFANANNEPETVWGSRTAAYTNFTTSTPLNDADTVEFSLAGRRVAAVHHLVDLETLLLFASSGVFRIEGNEAGILVPGEINPRRIAPHGAHPAFPPLEVTNTILYVQARGQTVRSLLAGVVAGYSGTDLTVFSSHLFRGRTLVDWGYAETPDSVVWVARSDGMLLSFTYVPEHDVWGWARHDLGGSGVVENVTVLPEGDQDRVYLVVRRTIDGATVRSVERMATRYVPGVTAMEDVILMDAALSYDGWNTGATTMTLSGGSTWLAEEDLTCTASAATFDAGDVGNEVWLADPDADADAPHEAPIRCVISGYTSSTVVTVRPQSDVPEGLQGVAVTDWALAVDAFAGLEHLEGASVSVLGDGAVVHSPNNADYDEVTVESGGVTISEPHAVVHIGLPYVADLETVGLEWSERGKLVNRVALVVEGSRGIWCGQTVPDDDPLNTDSDPLWKLDEVEIRTEADEYDETEPVTGTVDVTIRSSYDDHGRVVVRQVDPLPLTINAILPVGYLPAQQGAA